MGLLSEYINRGWSAAQLQEELKSLITKYNIKRSTFLLVFATAIGKNIPDIPLSQDDYYTIVDILRSKVSLPRIDIYLETPGGSGEAAEEIVNYLRAHFDSVSFVVSGEAKSAGTLMVLSGNEILMTETGSLGPIDAQMRIGRTVVSAFDYTEWIDEKREDAAKTGKLNPFDATMIAQISPGELKGVYHSLKFAEDLVVDWLTKYKFKNWNETETRKLPVTEAMKKQRAGEIVGELINHAKWRSHGRSIKIGDLEDIKLKITKVDQDPELCDIVNRIQTVCRLLFISTSTYKLFATHEEKILKQAMRVNNPLDQSPPKLPDVANMKLNCPKCQREYRLYAKFNPNPNIDKGLQAEGFSPFPKDNKIQCGCGFEINLAGMRNELEVKSGRKVVD